jgi:hypothetical protein
MSSCWSNFLQPWAIVEATFCSRELFWSSFLQSWAIVGATFWSRELLLKQLLAAVSYFWSNFWQQCANFVLTFGSRELLLKQLLAAWSYCWSNFSVQLYSVLRIRDVYPVFDFFSIPDPNLFHHGSRIRIKEFKYFNPEKWFLSSRKYDSGCSSRIRIPDPDPDFLPIPNPGSRGKKGNPGSGSATLNILKYFLIGYPCCSIWNVRRQGGGAGEGSREGRGQPRPF